MSLIGMHHREVCAHRLLRPQLQAARALPAAGLCKEEDVADWHASS